MEINFLSFVQSALPVVSLLVPIVIAFVQLLGKFGVEGKWQLLGSLLSGLVLGVCGMIAQLGLPANFALGFSYAVVGLITGLSASGVYDAVKHAVVKAQES